MAGDANKSENAVKARGTPVDEQMILYRSQFRRLTVFWMIIFVIGVTVPIVEFVIGVRAKDIAALVHGVVPVLVLVTGVYVYKAWQYRMIMRDLRAKQREGR